jgi:hypothetical protein
MPLEAESEKKVKARAGPRVWKTPSCLIQGIISVMLCSKKIDFKAVGGRVWKTKS